MKARKLIESGIVAAALVVATVATAGSGNVKDTSQSSKQANNETVFLAEHKTTGNVQGIAVANQNMSQMTADTSETVNVTANFVEKTATASMDQLLQTESGEIKDLVSGTILMAMNQNVVAEDVLNDTEKEEKTSEWMGKLLADVDNNLNVRAQASEKSEIVGRMYKGAAAEVVEKGDEWTKIKSGNVEGYVKNEFCVFDEEAEKLADKVCPTYATSTTAGLRVRETASTEAKILTVLEKQQKLQVDTEKEQVEGWVAVKYQDKTAYISAEYTDVKQNVKNAMTLEEEQKMIEKQEAERRAAEAAKMQAAVRTSASVSSKKDSGVSANVDDVTLLAALIYCEAGAEPYAGQLAVGAVVVNRVQSSAYPNTISGVIYQKGQFGPASSGKLARTLAKGNFSKCYKAAQEALSGVDNTGGAIGFNAGKRDGLVIGNQTFFK